MKYQENPDAPASGLGEKITAGQLNSIESPFKPPRFNNGMMSTIFKMVVNIATMLVKRWNDRHENQLGLHIFSSMVAFLIFQGHGTTFLSWKCSISYSEMIANSESCPYDGASQLVICDWYTLHIWSTSWQNQIMMMLTSIGLCLRCRWVRTF